MHHDKVALSNAVGGRNLLDHDMRVALDRTRSNETIDPTRTHLNVDYSVRQMGAAEAWQWAVDYAQAHSPRKIRANTVVLAMDVIHLPKNWFERYPDKPASEFFEQVALPFLRQRYGVENEVSAIVHYDEGGAPHLHRKSVPVTADGKLSHKAVYCRRELQQVHPALVRFAEQAGYPGLDLFDAERAEAREQALTMSDYKVAAAELDAVEADRDAAVQKLAVTKQAVKEETAALREVCSERQQAQEAVQVLTAAAEAAEERAEATRSALEGLEQQLKDKAVELDEHVEALAVAQDRLERVRQLAGDVERASTEVRSLAAQAAERGAAGGGWAERCTALAERVCDLVERVRAAVQALGEAFEQIRLLIPAPEPDDRIGRARKTAAVVNGRVMYSTPKPVGKKVERRPEPTINQLGKQAQQSIEAQRQAGIGGRGRGGRSGPER